MLEAELLLQFSIFDFNKYYCLNWVILYVVNFYYIIDIQISSL